MTAIADFLRFCETQNTDIDGGMPAEYVVRRDLLLRVYHVLVNFQDEESEFFMARLQELTKQQTTEDVKIPCHLTEHLIEYLKEQL